MTSSKKATRKHVRRTVSFLMALGFGVMVITGIVLFFAPRGWIARSTSWAFLGLGKWHWKAMHNTVAWLVLVTWIVHFALNWRIFTKYFKRTTPGGRGMVWDVVVASALVVLFTLGAAAGWSPFTALSGHALERAQWGGRGEGGQGWGRGRDWGSDSGQGWGSDRSQGHDSGCGCRPDQRHRASLCPSSYGWRPRNDLPRTSVVPSDTRPSDAQARTLASWSPRSEWFQRIAAVTSVEMNPFTFHLGTRANPNDS
jgi:hypothetical protein